MKTQEINRIQLSEWDTVVAVAREIGRSHSRLIAAIQRGDVRDVRLPLSGSRLVNLASAREWAASDAGTRGAGRPKGGS